MPPVEIARPVEHVATRIKDSDQLCNIGPEPFANEVAYLYDYLNFAHPFREGNGRTQREFFAQLLAESGHGLAWDLIEMASLHEACHVARTDGTLDALKGIFERIITDDPSY